MSGGKPRRNGRAISIVLTICAFFVGVLPANGSPSCPEERAEAPPIDRQKCAELAPDVQRPGSLPLDQYEAKLGAYLSNYCYRDAQAGWRRDKWLRDTGPFAPRSTSGAKWEKDYLGTHQPVIIWYSKEMYDWLKANRPEDGSAPKTPAPIPDGAMMIKEMYSPPAANCGGVKPLERLVPAKEGVAVMVRASGAAHDGWFWGAAGWTGWKPDWPPGTANPYPNLGFGQYCLNCHASAADNQTFASLNNIEGEKGEPLVFLIQNFASNMHWSTPAPAPAAPAGEAQPGAAPAAPGQNEAFTRFLSLPAALRDCHCQSTATPSPSSLASATYDNVWVAGQKADAGAAASAATTTRDPFSGLVTSDQCLGCHDAGSTGLQFDMTEPASDPKLLLNHSPYGSWRTSPMGMAGRDPIFYAQLASELDKFHPQSKELVQDTCFGCHGVLGQRRYGAEGTGADACRTFTRPIVDATPYPDRDPLARFGALARDGVSCQACHRIDLTGKPNMELPENKCVVQRQDGLNPENQGFAKTFTGSFFVVPGDAVNGPFSDPKPKPMQNALGITPHYDPAIKSSEVCGSCHTVHLPVLADNKTLGRFYEQTTYAEWAFSGYRTGTAPDGAAPYGAGGQPKSCQDCHMPSTEPDGTPFLSKIASIQEFSNFPQAEHALGRDDLDLQPRPYFAKHILVGLNLFLVEMAEQFPALLGLRPADPMLGQKGVDPLKYTEAAMVDQAGPRTATIALGNVEIERDILSATVTVTNNSGHKFPSGVGFRRAFVEFEALDANGAVLWASGRTDAAGIIVDASGNPIPGELWWKEDCSARLGDAYQRHRQTIDSQDQAQIYQELVTAPKAPTAMCNGGPADGQLTTSFLSICGVLKDNRLLPRGFLPLEQRVAIAKKLGADKELAEEAGSHGTGDDPAYAPKEGVELPGSQSVAYRIDLSRLSRRPAALQARLYYQAIPPFFLQDRFCTSKSDDTRRLYDMTSHLDLSDTRAAGWKLEVATTGRVALR